MTIKARVLVPLVLGFLWCIAPFARADTDGKSGAEPVYAIKPIAERHLDRLPAGPLFWRIERFPTLAQAQEAAGPASLASEIENKGWLFTLGSKDAVTTGAEPMAVIGPVTAFDAPSYLLRANLAGGPPGAKTPVHSHPGSEAFYVLSGDLGQKTPAGAMSITAGQTMAGHDPGMPMQVYNAGHTDLRALVLFVVDATKPFSSPATFP